MKIKEAFCYAFNTMMNAGSFDQIVPCVLPYVDKNCFQEKTSIGSFDQIVPYTPPFLANGQRMPEKKNFKRILYFFKALEGQDFLYPGLFYKFIKGIKK